MADNHWKNPDVLSDTTYGFVYRITNITYGKKYIGQKRLTKKVTRPPLKGKKRKRTEYVESDWHFYTGSSRELNEDIAKQGKQEFLFEIIQPCASKWELNYWEAYHIMNNHAIPRNDYYNGYLGRIGACPNKCKY